MAKEEPEHCMSPCFQSRLTEWGEQCLRFQASGEEWGPTKPCCPANPFLGLEGLEVWQGLKKDEAKACVELLSIEELLELHRVFLETVSTPEPQPAPGVVSAMLPNLQLRPWAGSPEASGSASSCQKPSEVEPISSERTRGQGKVHKAQAAKAKAEKAQRKPKATAKASGKKQSPCPSKVKGVYYSKDRRCWRVGICVPFTNKQKFGGYFVVKKDAEAKAQELTKELQKASGSAVTEASPAERRPDSPSTKKRTNEAAKAKKLKRKPGKATGIGIGYCSRSRSWRVAVYDPAIKRTKHGGYFRTKKDALAQVRELAKTKKPSSDVKGVYCYRNSWNVHVYDSATRKATYGGSFKFKQEAEARAKQLAKNAGVAWRKL
ncbi:DEGP10 [Symbiodinium sp. CCMP2592]|nr:DEGP10 [Symbiodinium sp. CCMP2592]